ncbi:MAG: hypothetical protein KBB83_02000 [Alphaproteobacteria bacterium]|nr:hypothetical protein [Alphaproteobacteria bacterium]
MKKIVLMASVVGISLSSGLLMASNDLSDQSILDLVRGRYSGPLVVPGRNGGLRIINAPSANNGQPTINGYECVGNTSYEMRNNRVVRDVNQRQIVFSMSDGTRQILALNREDDLGQVLSRARRNNALGLPLDWVSSSRYCELNPEVYHYAQERNIPWDNYAIEHYKTCGKRDGRLYK